MKPTVIGFSGRIKSGKTTISQAVAGALQLKRASFGDFVRDVAVYRGLDADCRQVLQQLGESLIAEGWLKFCRDVLQATDWTQGESIVVDGIRHADAVTELSRLAAPMPVVLVHVETDEKTRITRLARKELIEQESIKSHSTERDVREVLPSMAKLVVDGTKPIDVVVEEIAQFIADCSSSK